MRAMALSVLTLVRVERLFIMMAIVWPARAFWITAGVEPDLTEDLMEEALRIRVVSSAGVRSAIERRWRGAKGESSGEVENVRRTVIVWLKVRRQLVEGRGRRDVAITAMSEQCEETG